jgi:hypothetical protein
LKQWIHRVVVQARLMTTMNEVATVAAARGGWREERSREKG